MSRKGKNFFYRIDPEEVISEIFLLRGSERGKWLIQFLFDLRNDDPDAASSKLAKLIIEEAKQYRNSKSVAGRASAEKRATTVQHKSNKIEHKSNKVQPETEAVNKEIYKEIIDDLNSKGGFRYQVCDSVMPIINGRLNEGFTKEDFFLVHSNMVGKWGKDPNMSQYLRPATLYLASKFQGYLNQPATAKTKTIRNQDGELIQVPYDY